MKTVILIPAYNEAATIRELVQRVIVVAEELSLDIVVVDDGSTDNTSEKISDLPITLFRNEPNQGKAASLWRGMQWAMEQGAEGVISLDGDTQHRPEDIPRFVKAAEKHPNRIIIGSRLHDKDKIPTSRYRANRFANFWVAWASGYPIEDSQTGFRYYPVSFLRTLDLDTSKDKGFVFESEILIQAGWQGIQTYPLPIPAIYADNLRESHFKGVEDITKITRMIARRIISRGMFLPGLYRSTFKPMLQRNAIRGIDTDALWMLLISLLVGLLTLGLSHLWLLFKVIYRASSSPCDFKDIDVINVAGHALEQGELSSDYSARLLRALQLHKLHPQAKVLILGGRPQSGISEAQAGASFLQLHGMPAGLIQREEQSTNTLDNLRNSSEWLNQFTTPVVVSNRYHLQRIAVLSTNIGLKLLPVAAETQFHPIKVFWKLIVETVYLHWYLSGRYFAKLTGHQRILGKSG
ncbi:MAG: glycosyltransferase [Xanthomonadales bacterium]|nr:glycosyltransferase [Xanthomonadales bacterium]